MKLTLTKYGTGEKTYQDVKVAELGVNCPYAVKLQWRRFCFTVYRWNCPTVCISKDATDENLGGSKESWAKWVLWQDKPWGRFQFWHRNRSRHFSTRLVS